MLLALQARPKARGSSRRSPARSASTGRTSSPRSSASASSAPCCTCSPTSRSCRCWRRGAQQIASGLANAEKIKAELARIEAERQDVLAQGRRRGQAADRGGPRRRRPGPGRGNAEGDRGRRADPRPGARSRRARSRADARRAQARGRPARRADDGGGDRQDPDAGRSPPAGRRDGAAAGVLDACADEQRHDSDESEPETQARGAAAVPRCASSTACSTRSACAWCRAAASRASRRRGALALSLLSHFQRLVRLDRDRHTAVVESAAPLRRRALRDEYPGRPRARLRPGTGRRSSTNPALIGGMRIRSAATSTTAACAAGWRRWKHGF